MSRSFDPPDAAPPGGTFAALKACLALGARSLTKAQLLELADALHEEVRARRGEAPHRRRWSEARRSLGL